MDKIRLKKLTESFGKSIINENFEGNQAAQYYLDKDIIRECDELSVEHLETCSDMSTESILEMTEQCDGHEINLEEDSLNSYINEACKHINSCDAVFENEFMIDGGNINTSGEATKYFVEGIQKISEQYRLLEVKDIDMKNLYDIVHTKLTDDQISLVHNMIYNDGNFNYEPSFRNDVMEHLQNNDESSAAKLIGGVYGKRKGLFEVVKQVGLTEARKVQKNGINLTAGKSSVTRAIKLTEGYAVDTHKIDDVDTLVEAVVPKKGDKVKILIGERNYPEFFGIVNSVEERSPNEHFADISVYNKMGKEVEKSRVVPFDYLTIINETLTEDSDGIDVGSRVSFEHIVDGETKTIVGTVEKAVGEFYDIRHEVVGTETGEKMMTTKKDDELTRLIETDEEKAKLTEYADETVHVYEDKEKTKMFGTGFVDMDGDKFKTEMKDGVESVLVKWDSSREDYFPVDQVKLAEASNPNAEYDSVWLQDQMAEHLRMSAPSPRHRPAYEYLLSRINQSYPDGDISMKMVDELLAEPRANDLIGMGFKEDLDFFWNSLS